MKSVYTDHNGFDWYPILVAPPMDGYWCDDDVPPIGRTIPVQVVGDILRLWLR